MSWWGKVIGGLFGYLLHGPITGLIGLALGHAIDSLGSRHQKNTSISRTQRSARQAKSTYFSTTFSVMGHVCKADGRISEDEIRIAKEIMERMALSPRQREAAIRLFNVGKTPEFQLNEALFELRKACNTQKNLLRMFMEIQITAAFADGDLHPVESRLLRQIAERLGILRMEYENIENRVRVAMRIKEPAERTHSEKSINDAYTVLGVTKNMNDREIKRAYRRLLNQHHPDKLVSKGLPEEMMQLASQKTHEIRQAYEMITLARKQKAN